MNEGNSGDVRPAVLNCETPLGQALISMFGSLARELEAENAPPGALRVIVFGGCAVHLYTSHRVSMDVDAEFFSTTLPSEIDVCRLLAELPEEFLDDQTGRLIELTYDLNFSPGLGPLHEDYLERGLRLPTFDSASPFMYSLRRLLISLSQNSVVALIKTSATFSLYYALVSFWLSNLSAWPWRRLIAMLAIMSHRLRF